MKSFNKDVEEGVAVLAALADQGIKAQLAGSALSRIMLLLSQAQLKNKEALERYNIELFDSQGKMRNLADIIESLENAFVGMSDEERIAALAAIGFRTKVQAVILPLLGSSEAIRQFEKDLRSAGGTTKEVADNQMTPFQKGWAKLTASVTQFSATIMTVLGPALNVLFRSISGLLRVFSGLAKIISLLPKWMQIATVSAVGLSVSLWAVAVAANAAGIAIKKALIGTVIGAGIVIIGFALDVLAERLGVFKGQAEEATEAAKKMQEALDELGNVTEDKDKGVGKKVEAEIDTIIKDRITELRDAAFQLRRGLSDIQMEEFLLVWSGATEEQAAQVRKFAGELDKLAKARERKEEWKREHEERMRNITEEGKRLTESLRTPLEMYRDKVAEINRLFGEGLIGEETKRRALTKAGKERLAAEKRKDRDSPIRIGLRELGRHMQDLAIRRGEEARDMKRNALLGQMVRKQDEMIVAIGKQKGMVLA